MQEGRYHGLSLRKLRENGRLSAIPPVRYVTTVLAIVVPAAMFGATASNSALDNGVVSAEDIIRNIAAATFVAEKDFRRHPRTSELDAGILASSCNYGVIVFGATRIRCTKAVL